MVKATKKVELMAGDALYKDQQSACKHLSTLYRLLNVSGCVFASANVYYKRCVHNTSVISRRNCKHGSAASA